MEITKEEIEELLFKRIHHSIRIDITENKLHIIMILNDKEEILSTIIDNEPLKKFLLWFSIDGFIFNTDGLINKLIKGKHSYAPINRGDSNLYK